MASPAHRHRIKPKAGRLVEPTADSHGSPRISKTEIACWAGLFMAAVGALLSKHYVQFFYSWTDEQIHFYVARRLAEGAVLYRDIDSARPPLVVLPLSWLIRMGCPPLLGGRALVLGTQLATAGLLFWGGRRLASWRAGALTALLFLSSPEVFDRIHYTGIHLVALTATACVLFSLRAQPLRAGLSLGLTLAADQHGLVVLAMTEAVFLYVVVIAPLLTLLAGIGFDATITWGRLRNQLSPVRAQRAFRLLLAGAAGILALTAGGWAAARSHRERLDNRHYSFWPHVLHGQVSRLQQLDAALRGIGESMLPKDGTIFGDPTIVSALALHSGRRVSGELADLNPNWIEAGTVGPEAVVSRIERDGVAAVITPPWGLVQNPYFKSYLFACYEKPKPFFRPPSGPGEGLPPFILVFTHLPGPLPCQAPAP
jgi:hypothetical protein